MAKGTKLSISAELKDGKAHIRITDTISNFSTSSSLEIRSQVDAFIAAGIRKADVYLSCRGGDCFEAVEMVNELNRLDEVKISVGAVAASAGTYLTSSFYTVAKSNSQFMFHRPSLSTYGNEDAIISDLKLLQQTTNDYYARYSQKTGMPEEEIKTMLSNGDLWLTAAEALEYGFIDAIEDQGNNAPEAAWSAPTAYAGERAGWTLEDYIDKDIKAYERMHTEDPARARQLEAAYFGSPVKGAIAKVMATIHQETGRESWTLEDYLDKDLQAYKRMQTEDPARAKQLEAAYFNS